MSRTTACPAHRSIGLLAVVALLASGAISGAVRAAPLAGDAPVGPSSADHLVLSEVLTGGASASDEFVELYNPSAAPRSLDGVELVYVTASGATITRKAIWGAGVVLNPRAHVLVANAAGIFAGVADATYANGLAATGGSLALRLVGAATAVDAVGWGTAASAWLETMPAPAPPAGSSLERLPGGVLGSGQDTDDNLADFAVRPAPDPQNGGSPPIPSPTPVLSPTPTSLPSDTASPGPTPTPLPTETPGPTPTPLPTAPPAPTDTPMPSGTPAPLTVSEARALPDGSQVVVRGVSLTGSAFSEGGGYLADSTGGIAVLVDGAVFSRGMELLLTGVVDNRYAQRTIRVEATGLTVIGPGTPSDPLAIATGSVAEPVEGQLVTISGRVQGAPVSLSAGEAFEIDDGSGPIRVLVGPGTGIGTADWVPGATLGLTGVVGQRDSSGTGEEGYRVQPRESGDIGFVLPPSTPSPTPTLSPTPSPSASPTPTPSPSPPSVVPIADARQAETGTRLRIRGVVTLPTGLVDASTAVVADPSGAILVRAGSEFGRLARGQLVELTGLRSTYSGMISLRVTLRAVVLGTQAEPPATRRATGAIREEDEAILVVVRGIVGDGPRRTTGGGLSFTVNDGSGALRVFAAPASAITAPQVPAGAWIELVGVVGQQTTTAEPSAGYRLWPRDRADVRVEALPSTGDGKPIKTVRTSVPTPVQPSAAEAALLIPPNLGTAPPPSPAASAAIGPLRDPGPAPATRIPVPLAAGLGGVAGMLTLAWRHGTLRRFRREIQRRADGAPNEAHGGGDDKGESYTPAP